MGMLSLADILLTDAQVSYKENRIIIYFKVNAEVNLAFKEHIQSLYNRFIKQETILVTIEEHSFESHIISLASAASPEEYVSDDLVERLMCGDEFTLTVENDGSIPADAAYRYIILLHGFQHFLRICLICQIILLYFLSAVQNIS
jgi:hypothetical protein